MELFSYSIIWGSRRRRDAHRLPNEIQVSGRGGDLGPAGCMTGSQRPTLGSRHWDNQPGLLHSRCPGPTRTCSAGLRPAARFDRRRQLSGPLLCAAECPGGDQRPPRRLDPAPRLPFCMGSRLGLGPVPGVRWGGSGRGEVRKHRWRPPQPELPHRRPGVPRKQVHSPPPPPRSIAELRGGPVVATVPG